MWKPPWRANLPLAGSGDAFTTIHRIDQDVLPAMEKCIAFPDCSILAANVNLFVITGGPIVVTEFVGIVTTNIQAAAAVTRIQQDVITPAGTVSLSTAVDLTGVAAGTSITFTAATPGVLTPTTAGALDQLPKNYWLCPIGKIKAEFGADRTGKIAWYMVYKPLSPKSVVAVA